MPVTIKQIAQETGLSVPTVSRIINKNGQGHRSETANRVLEAARRLGYRVNSAAQATRRGHFGSVGLLLSTVGSRSLMPRFLMDGILDALAEREIRLTVSRIPDERLTSEIFMSRLLRESASDGLLINYNSLIPEQLVALIEEFHIPAVWINSRQETDCVHPDDLNGAYNATENLLKLGHRRIAYVDFVLAPHYSSQDRYQGYCQAMREKGYEPLEMRPMPALNGAEQVDYCTRILSRPDRPTAVLAYSPQVLQPVLFAAFGLKIRIPEDLSVIHFDVGTAEHLGKRVGTMRLPQYEIGQAAIEMVLDKISEPTRAMAPRRCALLYQPGDTCIPPTAPDV